MAENTITWYFVSTYPGKIDTDDQGTPLHYQSQTDAEDSIKTGEHGDMGTRYVIKAELETVAVASRSWELRRVEAPADPFRGNPPPVFGGLYDSPSPTGPGV